MSTHEVFSEDQEIARYRESLEFLQEDVLPIVKGIQDFTLEARAAMGGLSLNSRGETVEKSADTLVLSNVQVELAILLQRLGDRISEMGYITRASEELYKRVLEGHKVRLTTIGVEQEVVVKDPDTGAESIGHKTVTYAAGVADSMKIGLSHKAFEFYNLCQKQMDQLSLIRKSTDKTIDAIRSKLSREKANDKNA